ncbi:hypothetical protein [Caldimonas thermodepolymerans]|uniref:hypothetical protein n=1 Tax=Caldimonas thermodepolymerans TaxID=215580 RepID=UPI002490BE26|nr:hypothetical protein [Caldimonas thermodepolymerans]
MLAPKSSSSVGARRHAVRARQDAQLDQPAAQLREREVLVQHDGVLAPDPVQRRRLGADPQHRQALHQVPVGLAEARVFQEAGADDRAVELRVAVVELLPFLAAREDVGLDIGHVQAPADPGGELGRAFQQ